MRKLDMREVHKILNWAIAIAISALVWAIIIRIVTLTD